MNANGLFNVAGAIVTVAAVTAFVSSPQTANIIRAVGAAFGNAIRASLGK